jgi:hypothetical protein
MSDDEKKAMQEFIDRQIRPALQEHYPNYVACYAQGWEAALTWKKQHPDAPHEDPAKRP